jgi:hypothetical protein
MITDLNKLKERNLLFQIEAAKSHGKLAEGVTDVWIAAKRRNGELLIAEKEILFKQIDDKKLNELVAETFLRNKTMQAKEAIDDAIQNVLNNGGEVEFVENGLLKKYKHLVIIEPY